MEIHILIARDLKRGYTILKINLVDSEILNIFANFFVKI